MKLRIWNRVTPLLLIVLILATMLPIVVTAANNPPISINFVEGKAVYDPSAYYFKKNTTKQTWDCVYTFGWNATTQAYLYNRDIGAQVTKRETLVRGTPRTGMVNINASGWLPSHYIKLVAVRDISQYSGPYRFDYTWGN